MRTPCRPIVLGVALLAFAGQPSATWAQAAEGSASTVGQSTASANVVDPMAVAALKRMSSYLAQLRTIEITSESSLDAVTQDGQRVQLDGVTTYKIRKPGFVIEYNSDIKNRRFIYDGKKFTVLAPKLGFFATAPAPGTNREVLDLAYQKYGIKLPLEDLFRWSEPGTAPEKSLKSAYALGTATLGGVATDHYVFREDAIDWEVWIQQGNEPVPKKLVIVDRTDPAHPTFIARLDWKVNPPLGDADFAFTPGADQKRIEFSTLEGSGE